MARYKCDVCDHAFDYKSATFYWAWRYPSDLRVCHRQKRCRGCSVPVSQRINLILENPNDCVMCEDATLPGDRMWVNATMYIPGAEKDSFSFVYHPKCFELDMDFFTHGAVRLPDRPEQDWGPPRDAGGDPWLGWREMTT